MPLSNFAIFWKLPSPGKNDSFFPAVFTDVYMWLVGVGADGVGDYVSSTFCSGNFPDTVSLSHLGSSV